MNGQQIRAGAARAAHGAGDGVWDVVQLEVEKDVLSATAELLDDAGTLGEVKLQANLVPEHVLAQGIDERQSGITGGVVQRDDQTFPGGHGSSVPGYAGAMSERTNEPCKDAAAAEGTTARAESKAQPPTAMTIAGYDPGAGAGIVADVLTFARFGVFATSAITALTVQSTRGVRRVQPVDAMLLRDTLEELEADLPADGIKIGMLAGEAQVRVVADFVRTARRSRAVTIVLDPVLVSSSGATLLDQPGLNLLQAELLPLVDVMTPNTDEASRLTGLPCHSASDAERCAERLAQLYPHAAIVLTGGHLEEPSDLLWHEGRERWYPGKRIMSDTTHGTGCVFSSALLASRLQGAAWAAAVECAKNFVAEAIRKAVPRGSGKGPMHLVAAKA